MGLKFSKIGQVSAEVAALEIFPLTYNGRNIVSTLVHSFWNGSSSCLNVTRTIIIAWMRLNFSQILSPTIKLAAIERLKNQCQLLWVLKCLHFNWIVFILTCNKNSYNILDGFQQVGTGSAQLDLYRRNVVNTLEHPFLDGSSSFLKITRTTIND